MNEILQDSINQEENVPFRKVYSEEKLRTLILKKSRSIYVPSSVYRIQLNRNCTFKDVEKIIPYLHNLGIEALYCSPFLQAVPGSMHGYDVTGPDKINIEIGNMGDLKNLCKVLNDHKMGLIADIVPNHMGIAGNNNFWWQDVLENGRSSIYARYFDVDWKPLIKHLTNKILLPVLGNFYGKVLENKELQLNYDQGAFFLNYFSKILPIDPGTYPLILNCCDNSLSKIMGAENADYLEFLSIITSFRNLPKNTEDCDDKIQERNREKEISKRRLKILLENCDVLKKYITERIEQFNGEQGKPSSFDALDELLNLQSYRLTFWAVASQEINYRRFFDINDLAAIKTEDEQVFDHYHRLIFSLIREGVIDGLRIDHPDGLYDPPEYFKRLQTEYILQMVLKDFSREKNGENNEEIDIEAVKQTISTILTNEFVDTPAFYTVVEKILDRNESLPTNWMVHGTVGYDFLNALNGLFVRHENETKFADLYERFIGHRIDYDVLVYDKKKYLSTVLMGSEINSLGQRLNLISKTNRKYRDFTLNELIVAIGATIACFPVYRTYVSAHELVVSERDEKNICSAIKTAKVRTPMLNPLVYDFLQDVLLLKLEIDRSSDEMKMYADFLLRFQQLTGPIMAKGVEDTSFYVYNRLVSLNEVGGDPFHFGHTPSEFHEHNSNRVKRWPKSMINSSTHDTKRSEDCRMRINILSEIPHEWELALANWSELNQAHKTMINGIFEPRRNTEYFIYQAMIGIWPDSSTISPSELEQLSSRLWSYLLKSIREAKIYTDWNRPNQEYETAVKKFLESICVTEGSFYRNFSHFLHQISYLGQLSSLSAVVAKCGAPGVVDIYQGNETWNYSLVDPDNRREHNYDDLESKLRSLDGLNHQVEVFKMFVSQKALTFRRDYKQLFVSAEYFPVPAQGTRGENVVAFICKHDHEFALTVFGRFFCDFGIAAMENYDRNVWSDTSLILPDTITYPDSVKNIFNGDDIPIVKSDQNYTIRLSDIFKRKTVAILTNIK